MSYTGFEDYQGNAWMLIASTGIGKMNQEEVLIPEEILLQVKKDELDTLISELLPRVIRDSGKIGEALDRALLFKYWPELLPGPRLSLEQALFNEYYWFKRFAILKEERDGYDSSIEQQLFHVATQIDFEPDWALSVFEWIEAEAATIES